MTDFRKGDKIRVEGEVVKVETWSGRACLTVRVRGGKDLVLSDSYLDFVERPKPKFEIGAKVRHVKAYREETVSPTIASIIDGWFVLSYGPGVTPSLIKREDLEDWYRVVE